MPKVPLYLSLSFQSTPTRTRTSTFISPPPSSFLLSFIFHLSFHQLSQYTHSQAFKMMHISLHSIHYVAIITLSLIPLVSPTHSIAVRLLLTNINITVKPDSQKQKQILESILSSANRRYLDHDPPT